MGQMSCSSFTNKFSIWPEREDFAKYICFAKTKPFPQKIVFFCGQLKPRGRCFFMLKSTTEISVGT